MSENSSLIDVYRCSYLSYNSVSSLATISTSVMLQVNESTSIFGDWTSTAVSTNSLAVTALTYPSGNWHNGATFDNWDWSGGSPVPSNVSGWPNMFQAAGNGNGVHWYIAGSYLHSNISEPVFISATWIR